MGAQPQGGLCKIWLQTEEAREYLLNQVSTLRFNGRRIELHGDNPYTSPHLPFEKITIRDLSPNVSNEEIMSFLDTNHRHVVPRSNVILGRIPSRDNRHLSAFYNGDQIVYVKGGGASTQYSPHQRLYRDMHVKHGI